MPGAYLPHPIGARIDYRSLCDLGHGKPLGMHWRTHSRIRKQFRAAYAAGLEEWNAEMNAALSALRTKISHRSS